MIKSTKGLCLIKMATYNQRYLYLFLINRKLQIKKMQLFRV